MANGCISNHDRHGCTANGFYMDQIRRLRQADINHDTLILKLQDFCKDCKDWAEAAPPPDERAEFLRAVEELREPEREPAPASRQRLAPPELVAERALDARQHGQAGDDPVRHPRQDGDGRPQPELELERLAAAALAVGVLCTRLEEDTSFRLGEGVVFKAKEGGKMVDTWPVIKRIDPGVVQRATPGLAAGWRLLTINGVSVKGMLFKDAAPLTKVRPLVLCWRAPRQIQRQQQSTGPPVGPFTEQEPEREPERKRRGGGGTKSKKRKKLRKRKKSKKISKSRTRRKRKTPSRRTRRR